MAEQSTILTVNIDIDLAQDNILKLEQSVQDTATALKKLEAEGKKNTKEYVNLNAQYKATNQILKEQKTVLQNVAKSQSDVKVEGANMVKELRNIKVAMQGVEEGSDAWNKMAVQAGKVQDKLNAIKDLSKTFAVGSDFELGLNTLKGGFDAAAGAAQTLEGAQALLGEENENVTKSIQKMMAIQSIVNGVQGIWNALQKEGALVQGLMTAKTAAATAIQAAYTTVVGASTGALKAFKVALASTGIGALVVLLGSAVAGLYNVISASDGASESLDEMAKSNEDFISSLANKYESTNEITQKNIDLLKEQGKSIGEVYNAERNLILDKLLQQRMLFNETKYGYSEELKALKAKEGVTQYEIDALITKRNLALEAINNTGKQLKIDLEILKVRKERDDRELANTNKLAKLEANLLKQKENTQAYLKAELKLINEQERQAMANAKTEGERSKAKETAIDSRIAAEQKLIDFQYTEGRKVIDQANGLRDEELRNIELLNQTKLGKIEEATKSEIDAEKNRLALIRDAKLAENSKDLQDELAQKDLTKAQIDAINLKYANNEIAITQETGNAIKAIDDDVTKASIENSKLQAEQREQALAGSVQVTSDLLGSLAANFAENSEEYKALATTQAVIDTYGSANAAYKSAAEIPYVGFILGPIAAAAAVAAGIANVRKIQSADKNTTGSASSTGVSLPNYSLNTNTGIASSTNKFDTGGQPKTQTVLVVDDVTAAQNTQDYINKTSSI
jgi:hypothetical protein